MTESYGVLQFLFHKYTESEYLNEAWLPIHGVLKQFLFSSTNNFKPTSYQTTYCKVYKSACKGYKERLFNDLKSLITEHCNNVKKQLDESMKRIIEVRSNAHMNIFIVQFTDFLQQYRRAIQVIVPLFHYLDIAYVRPTMRSTIEHELLLIYKTIIVESHINNVFTILPRLIITSDSPSNDRVNLLLNLINDITPECATRKRDLFKQYCNGEDVILEITSNEDDMIMPTPRMSSKRLVDDLPGEEDQPSAKRTTNMVRMLQNSDS